MNPATESEPNPAAPARLLVVDDEEGLLYLMVDTLKRQGYGVDSAESGHDALALLERGTPDLLLLDLRLNDVPAPLLIERLRERGREIPFIVVTGHGDERTAVEVMKQGALDYVMKDAAMLELLPGIVRRALTMVERDRRLAEASQMIRAREQRYQKVIQTAQDGFVRFDRNGTVLEVNGAFCGLLGCPEQDVIGSNLFVGAAPVLDRDVRERIEEMAAEDSARLITRMQRCDGASVEVEVSLRGDGGAVFGFFHDVSEQRRLEREVLNTSIRERSLVGRELHDGLGQHLTALEMMTHTLARELDRSAPEKSRMADQIADYTRQAVAQTRQLSHDLAPVAPGEDGLIAGLTNLANLTTAAGVKCTFETERPVEFNDVAAATNLYRIAQEAVNNALKHSGATQIALRLADRGATVELTIEDNGRGLDKRPAGDGMGLRVMQHRATLVGGKLAIQSRPRKGVMISVTLPKHV